MTVVLTTDDKRALVAFWKFYQPLRRSISERLLAAIASSREWSEALQRIDPAERVAADDRTHQLQAMAILEDQWEPYLASLRAQGEHYALAGLSYSAWLEMLGAFRDV